MRLTRSSIATVKYGVTSLTIDRVRVGTRPIVSFHQRNVAQGRIGMTKICMTSFTAEMHMTRLKTGARSVNTLSKNDEMRRTMTIMVPSMTNLTDNTPLKEGTT
jgi:hypothetical protein